MNAWRMYDVNEHRREYAEALQVLQDEEESELAEQFDKQLTLSKLESMFYTALSADRKAVDKVFMDDNKFQNIATEFLRYAAETIATSQAKINRSLQ